MGQYHTLELEIDHPFWLEKDCWDAIYLERLEEASDPSKKAELAVVMMQEGLANICLVTPSMTVTKSRIERNMPKKRQVRHHHVDQMFACPFILSICCIFCCIDRYDFISHQRIVGAYILLIGIL